MSGSPADRLRRVAPLIEAMGPDGFWLARMIETYLDSAADGARLDELLDLVAAPGGESWWRIARRAERDAALRALARQTGGNACQVAAMIGRYEGSAWPRDRALTAAPARYAGTPRQHLFEAFRATDGQVPTSPKQLRRILG